MQIKRCHGHKGWVYFAISAQAIIRGQQKVGNQIIAFQGYAQGFGYFLGKAAKYLQSRTKTESRQSLAALLFGLVGLQLQWSGEVLFS